MAREWRRRRVSFLPASRWLRWKSAALSSGRLLAARQCRWPWCSENGSRLRQVAAERSGCPCTFAARGRICDRHQRGLLPRAVLRQFFLDRRVADRSGRCLVAPALAVYLKLQFLGIEGDERLALFDSVADVGQHFGHSALHL